MDQSNILKQKLQDAENSIKYMKEEHQSILEGLHNEISTLQQKCSDLQYNIALGDVKSTKENNDDDQKSTENTDKTKRSCDNKCHVNPQSHEENLRITELEKQLRLQSIQHQRELEEKISKISFLEESIQTTKDINKLQNTCKSLYQDGDEIALNRIDDIACKAARRDIEYRERKIHTQNPKDIEHDMHQEDFRIELRGPFPTSRNTSERGSSRSRNSSGCLSNRLNSSVKSSPFAINEKSGVFDNSAIPDSSNFNFDDSMQATHKSRRRWEEDRSKLFRHKLQENKNISQFTGDRNPKLGRKSSLNLSSIDKLHGANRQSLPSKGDQNEENYCSHVLLYSYQNPPFSMPPSGGCRKTSGHASLPIDFRSSMTKALPPISAKTAQNIVPTSISGAKLNDEKTPNHLSLLRDNKIIQQSNILTSDGMSDAATSSSHSQILTRQLHEESAA